MSKETEKYKARLYVIFDSNRLKIRALHSSKYVTRARHCRRHENDDNLAV
jgi:hypothetical protein